MSCLEWTRSLRNGDPQWDVNWTQDDGTYQLSDCVGFLRDGWRRELRREVSTVRRRERRHQKPPRRKARPEKKIEERATSRKPE